MAEWSHAVCPCMPGGEGESPTLPYMEASLGLLSNPPKLRLMGNLSVCPSHQHTDRQSVPAINTPGLVEILSCDCINHMHIPSTNLRLWGQQLIQVEVLLQWTSFFFFAAQVHAINPGVKRADPKYLSSDCIYSGLRVA